VDLVNPAGEMDDQVLAEHSEDQPVLEALRQAPFAGGRPVPRSASFR
jgi:hypothetical protein